MNQEGKGKNDVGIGDTMKKNKTGSYWQKKTPEFSLQGS